MAQSQRPYLWRLRTEEIKQLGGRGGAASGTLQIGRDVGESEQRPRELQVARQGAQLVLQVEESRLREGKSLFFTGDELGHELGDDRVPSVHEGTIRNARASRG